MGAKTEFPGTALVTGASSGFGRLTALALARQGWTVYAGVRNPDAAAPFWEERGQDPSDPASSRIRMVKLDVTDEEEIIETIETIEREAGGLDALVNNAGYAAGGFVEELPLSAWRAQFETNVFGAVAVTRQALPLLRRSGRGRIVLVGSISGRIGFPGLAPYCASKHALEGLGESLRLELAEFGISVSLVEPGAYRTPIWGKGIEALSPPSADSPYARLYSRLQPMMRKSAAGGGDPERVAETVVRAITDKRPKMRYLPGRGEKTLLWSKAMLPWSWVERAALKAIGVRSRRNGS
ncbi:SDR family NAD(P)-dependent oxidoreductase [Cohnella caldifontis]|uniref:SDR family NAD(P)-dependent oxidoreductase n=1 Tax=Cohnella caldifontis TaxID=3027471 RepID=UPI0023EAE10E|nr:SDR family NAD(P)-dependent oxidoreductase [Cohnella sp. YIM B05605]